MHRRILRMAFAGLALWLLFAAWAQRELGPVDWAARGEGRPTRVLILYDSAPGASTELPAILAANLAGRFGRATLRRIDRYRAGDSARFDATFLLPATAAPEAVIADLARARRPVVRIGALDPRAPRVGGVVAVRYKGRDFPRDLRAADDIALLPSAGGEVLATAVAAGGREVPWAIRSGNLLQIAENPFAHAHEDDRYLVFADLLFELLAPRTAERHRAMIRIDQVGPDSDPRRVRALADLLAQEGIPFSVAVHPRYRDPEGVRSGGRPVRVDLRQNRELVRALDHAVSVGGTLVAQGFTHQTNQRRNPGRRVSGGDAEYFAADLDGGALALRGPLPGNRLDHWRARFRAAHLVWADAGLQPPLLFTTPLQAGSAEAYQAARAHHLARYERSLYFAGEAEDGPPRYEAVWQQQFFPFEAVDIRGDFLLPENLGVPTGARGVDRLIASAERNLVVRDGFASFAFPWHGDPGELRRLVRGIGALGYRFVGPLDVLADAPAHAAASLRRASPLALAAAGWVGDLPPLRWPLLIALLALVAGMWLAAERMFDKIGGPIPKKMDRNPTILLTR
jgi:hypothetical protein